MHQSVNSITGKMGTEHQGAVERTVRKIILSLESADSVNTKVVDDAVNVFTLAAFLELALKDEVGTTDSSEYLYAL